MTASIVQFLISAAVIVIAGGALTQFGEIISHRSRLGSMVVGGLLIAGATSLPELAINIHVVRGETPNLAAGDLIGSSLINLLILAAFDLTRYSQGKMLSKASAGNTLAACTSVALAAVVGVFIFLGPQLGNWTFVRMGPGSFVILAAYAIGFRLIYFGRGEASEKSTEGEIDSVIPRLKAMGLKGAVAGFSIAAAMILAAAPFLAAAAEKLAESTGLGGTFFGSLFVATCTSLPEVVTVFVAVRMKSFDLAVGNIFGSNCFNMLVFVPLDFVHEGSLLSAFSIAHVYTILCGIIVASVVILGQLHHVERKKPILEPDAWMAILLIIAAFTGLYFVK